MTNNEMSVGRVRLAGFSAMFVIGSLVAGVGLSPAYSQTKPSPKPATTQPQARPQTPPPAGQSDAELRRRNQELEAQLQALGLQLQESKDEMESMRLKVIELERQLGEARRGRVAPGTPTTPPSTQPESVTIDETLPTASPRTLLSAVKESFAQTWGKSNPGNAGDAQRTAYLKNAGKWSTWINRNFRGPISWHTRLISSQNGERGERTLTLVAVDPISEVKLGDQFEVKLSRSMVERLTWLEHEEAKTGVLVLRGTLVPTARVNEERAERGAFDRPRFIGPYVELLFAIELKSLMPVEQPKPGEEKTGIAPPPEKPAGPK